MVVTSRFYEFLPELHLRVSGPRTVLEHFDAEYAGALASESSRAPHVDVAFGGPSPSSDEMAVIGGHKTVRWRVVLGPPDAHPLRGSITLRGRPFAFGLSLVQGYFVEPLVSLAAARARYVLLPSAAIATEDAAALIIGRSRSGKSSVAVRALAAGKTVVGDDQVFVDRSGRSWPFPRRLRFYSDIAKTAPRAYRRMKAPTRVKLAALGGVRRLTGGFVAPPVRVAPAELGAAPARSAHRLARVVLVERGGSGGGLRVTDLDVDAAVEQALSILDEQRAKLHPTGSPAWAAALGRVREHEGDILRAAFRDVAIERLELPSEWDASASISALAAHVGVDSG